MTATFQTALKFDYFKQRSECDIFECTSWLNDSFFSSDDQVILKEEVKTYLIPQSSPLNLILFHLRIYSHRIDYRCDNRRFWLFAQNCQVPTPISQNLELEEQIRIFGAD